MEGWEDAGDAYEVSLRQRAAILCSQGPEMAGLQPLSKSITHCMLFNPLISACIPRMQSLHIPCHGGAAVVGVGKNTWLC